jgi:hypothetical protein
MKSTAFVSRHTHLHAHICGLVGNFRGSRQLLKKEKILSHYLSRFSKWGPVNWTDEDKLSREKHTHFSDTNFV